VDPRNHVVDEGPDPTREGAFCGGVRRIVTYLRMSALRPPRANVPAQFMQWTNAFAAARGNKTRRRSWA